MISLTMLNSSRPGKRSVRNGTIDDVRQAETSERGNDASSAAGLEAKRAAMTRRSSPAITLGVTGWVGGQVIVSH
jgi:hypothetical protein